VGSSVETQVLSIAATQEIIFEAPKITFNTPEASFTGMVKSEGPVASNSAVNAPTVGAGRAGAIVPTPALKTDPI